MPLTPQNEPNRAPDPFRDMSLAAVPSHQYKKGELIKINEHMLGYLCRPDRQSDDQRFNSILVLGGSEGGIWESAVEFWAQQGYLSLGVAYHRGLPHWGPFEWGKVPGELAQGIPDYLERIELTRFEDALKIMRKDPWSTGDLATVGVSRGGELALILGALYPEIRAVAALVPSAAVVLAHSWDKKIYTEFQANAVPAWQHNGTPYLGDSKDAAFCSVDTLGRIPVEQITAPVFLISGGTDKIWHRRFVKECPHIVNAEHIAKRRANPDDVAVHYPEAGHYFPLPDGIAFLAESHLNFAGGTSLEAIRQASIDAHTRLKEFLNRHHPSRPQTL
jgi:dienelactone hydrolase